MSLPGGLIHVLYIDRDGLVRCARLGADADEGCDGAATLVSRTGRALGPGDVLALLAPREPTEDQRAALWRAVQAGYRVETT